MDEVINFRVNSIEYYIYAIVIIDVTFNVELIKNYFLYLG